MTSVVDLLMPKLGLTMTEGTVVEWRFRAGARFRQGDIIAVVETEKIANDIEAASDGVVNEILITEGETVPVGTPIARIELTTTPPGNHVRPSAVAKPPPPITVTPTPARPKQQEPRVSATPLARRQAARAGLPLATIIGTGPKGRIKAIDVTAAIHGAAASSSSGSEPVQGDGLCGAVIEPTNHQKSLARRLTGAKQDVPHFYLATEAEMSRLLALRKELLARGTFARLSLTPLLLLALVCALADEPGANRVWRNEKIVGHASIDVGLAVNTEWGLYVPVLRNLGHVGLRELSRRAEKAADAARNGRLGPDDVGGGAVTLSNAGMHDVTYMTSIITPGHAATLGVGSVRPVFRPDENGMPQLCQEMGLVLSCDHRIFDGVSGLRFLNKIKAHIENPFLMIVG